MKKEETQESKVIVTLVEHKILDECENENSSNFVILSMEELDKFNLKKILEDETKCDREYEYWNGDGYKTKIVKLKNPRKNIFEFCIPCDGIIVGDNTYRYEVSKSRELLVDDFFRIMGDGILERFKSLISGAKKSLIVEVGDNIVNSLFFDPVKIANKILNDLEELSLEQYEILVSHLQKKRVK